MRLSCRCLWECNMGQHFSGLTRLASGSDKVVPATKEEEEDENVVGGETPLTKSRTCTDLLCLILLFLFLIPLGALLIYCFRYGDIYRIVNGYDRCGNVCGKITERVGIAPNDPRFTCVGADMTKKKYLVVRNAGIKDGESEVNVNRECVSSCTGISGYRTFLNRCLPTKSQDQVNTFFSKTGLSNFYQEVSEDLESCAREIVGLFFIALLFSVVLLLLLRFAIGLVVWVMMGAILVVCLIATAYLWSQWASQRDKLREEYRSKPQHQQSDIEMINVNSYLGYAIAASVITVIILLLIVIMRKRVRLVVQLFKEAGKAVAAMPSMLFLPWVTFVFLLVLIGLWVYTAVWIESAGILTSENNVNFNYKKDGAMQVTRWYNLLAMFWLTQFVIAGQHMVVAGAVGIWYFTRKKSELEFPVASSFGTLLRYHLGSIALGSLFMAIIQFVRVIMQALQTMLRGVDEDPGTARKMMLKICSPCLCVFEKVLAYLSRNSYIQIALRGCNFMEGGRRAFIIIGNNALRVAAINSVGDFVLFMGKIAVMLSTMLVGIALIQDKEGVHHVWVPVTLASLFGYLVAHTFMTVYEMAIDTIFICFCEDCEINDGLSKPYYMSKGLKEFVHGDDPSVTRPVTPTVKNGSTAFTIPA